jgi:hypothetical protein
MNDPAIKFVGEMEKLCLKDGDVLVLHCETILPMKHVEILQDAFAKAFPGHKAIVLNPGMKLGVIGG